jgi:uncharacterized protein (TIGR03067 family)
MNAKGVFVILAALLVSSNGLGGDATKQAMKQLQGTWTGVAVEMEGRRTVLTGKKRTTVLGIEEATSIIAGEQLFLRFFQKDSGTDPKSAEFPTPRIKGTFKSDPSKKPKTIDVAIPPLKGEKRGQALLGIYELKGDVMKVAFTGEGEKRSTEFKTRAGHKGAVYEFKKKP